MTISIIVPVFNRPDEVDELLGSLASARERHCEEPPGAKRDGAIQNADSSFDFEVIIVEDGSTVTCKDVVEKYAERLTIKYFFKDNSGPGLSRNYGAERAVGDYLVFLDSDCVVPPGWLAAIEKAINAAKNSQANLEPGTGAEAAQATLDAWGGADRAADNFTPMQQAVNYAMTSPLTTGGIRGGTKSSNEKTSGTQSSNEKGSGDEKQPRSLDKFHPRSFNMGVWHEVFERVGGFANMRFGEDIDLSYRILEAGFNTRLLPDAWVWHKRRTRWRQFFKQVFNSGSARVALSRLHPGTLKPVHLLPAVFTLGLVLPVAGWVVIPTIAGSLFAFLMMLSILFAWLPDVGAGIFTVAILSLPACMLAGKWMILGGLFLLPLYALWAAAIFVDAWRRTQSPKIALMSVWASLIQLTAYGLGFLRALFTRKTAFTKNFYR